MQLRNISRMIVIVLVVLVGAVAIIHQRITAATPSAPTLVGGTALGNTPIPTMSLRDQSGALITSKSLLGRPTVITFLDMTCTQECPLQAQVLEQTSIFMGAQKANQVNWIVVSVNPRNTPADADAFLAKNKVTVPVKVLLGSLSELGPVWDAYHIYVDRSTLGSGDITHSIDYFLIDRTGHERMVFVDAADPKYLSQDLSALLAQ
ncbi:MAG TPA: SCO family protein [Ktedonobacterales bacterium]